MSTKELSRLLDELRRRKRNRSVDEVEEVLKKAGFEKRDTGGGHTMWEKGEHTLTLPKPHGNRDKSLAVFYVAEAIRVIEASLDVEDDDDKDA